MLDQGWQTSSIEGQTANILDFVSLRPVTTTQLCKSSSDNTKANEYGCVFAKIYLGMYIIFTYHALLLIFSPTVKKYKNPS